MKGKLIEIFKSYKISPAQLADNIGVQRSSISHILSGRNKPSFDFIIKLLEKYPDLNAEWLLLGRGNMLKSNKKQDNRTIYTEGDLFSSQEREGTTSQSVEEKKYVTNRHGTGIETEKNSYINKEKLPELTNVNSVQQIIFVYDDNTFKIINRK